MAIIAFWSDEKQDNGKTASAVAVATMTALEHNFKNLLMQTNFADNSLETCFWDLNSNEKKGLGMFRAKQSSNVIDSGIDALIKLLSSNKISPDMITNYTRPIFKDRLEVLFGTTRQFADEYEKLKGVYSEIILNANKYYDNVFVDLNKGTNDRLIRDVLANSDIIVVNVTQGPRAINRYIEYLNSNPDVLNPSKLIVLIGRYDEESKYNKKNVSRYIGKKQAVCAIPYNTLFFEAIEESNVADFFIKYMGVSEKDKNRLFIDEVKDAVETILYKIEENKMNNGF